MRFKDVISFMADMKFEMEIRGTTPEYERAYKEHLEMLRDGLSRDHDLSTIKHADVLGPQAAAAFEDFKLWYASQR